VKDGLQKKQLSVRRQVLLYLQMASVKMLADISFHLSHALPTKEHLQQSMLRRSKAKEPLVGTNLLGDECA